MQREFVLGLTAMALGAVCQARAATPHQNQPQVNNGEHAVLVELFTSEGCSSCPPADDLLRSIDGTRTDQGALIVGVSEHVTYWDHGGWKDPFSSDAITERQNDYARRFHLDSGAYTPQMVVNGETQMVGSDRKTLAQAVQKAEMENGATVEIKSATIDGNAIEAIVSVAGELPKHGADIFAVVAQDETTEHVLRGENKGRTLAHASVARVMAKAGKIRGAGETTVRIALPSGLTTPPSSKRHLIIWVQGPDLGRVLGVNIKAF